MSRTGGPRYSTLALVVLGLACGDAPSAPNAGSETVLVSVAGIAPDDAGIVLSLTGAVQDVQPASAGFEVAWAQDAAGATTVAVVGPVGAGDHLLVVRRPGGLEPLRIEVGEVAASDGTVSTPPSAHALLRVGLLR
jgi:hypothetical protein